MSEIMEFYRQDGPRALDRLVDGELSDTDRRELLVALDQEADGWRRCALAFLESQALSEQLRNSPNELARSAARISQRATVVRKRGWPLRLSLAASLLIAF